MDSQVVLRGNLSFLSLGDILQLIGSVGGSGTLRVISKYAPTAGLIFFDKGNIIAAVNELLEPKKKNGVDAVYSLFGWIEGEYEFTREDISVAKTITTNRMEIILDGLRMVDEGVVPILGPVSFDKKGSDSGKGTAIPVIKGPLADYMYVVDEEGFYKGRKIAEENSHGSWVWVILEGVVDIIKETPQGPLTMLRIADGAFLGSLGAFLFQSSLRSYTAVASTKVQLGVLDSQRLSNEFSGRTREFRELMLSLDKRLREVTDRTVEIYLNQDKFEDYAKDKILLDFKQEGKEQTLFKIKKGEALIVRQTKEGYVPLANLGADDFIGNIPFLDLGHEPQSASVFVSQDIVTVESDVAAMQKEFRLLSTTLKNMVENLANCISVITSSAVSFRKQNVRKK
ncbi:MAG: hypothetical protein BWK80_28935 [Desulfobacteraceae bacterium IS3]|nr:MAG: hypothetical protein BWK80_28935 [Desulfobacteraceae bacterium IS3]